MIQERSEPGFQIYSAGWMGGGRGFQLRAPRETLVARSVDEVIAVLREAEKHAASGAFVAGWVAYEAAPAFDAAFGVHPPSGPLAWFGVYDAALRDPHEGAVPPHVRIREPRFSLSAGSYLRAFDRIQDAIHEGDVYQINFTAPLSFALEGAPLDLWRALVSRQPVPFGAFVDAGEHQILCCSPELFFRRSGDVVVTRPMKGTVRRGAHDAEDAELGRWLASDPKSRAENVMIVDLLRNDLSRCCIPGSVRVPELFVTERYSTVIQMTSEIQGRLREGVGTADVFEALFPCGSVTGAPKIEAVRLITELEPQPRGVYCGAVGFMHGRDAVFSVGIRTVVVRGDRGVLGIGSGLVADSDADSERDECLLKARFLTDLAPPANGRAYGLAYGLANGRRSRRRVARAEPDSGGAPCLIETMRSEDGCIPLLSLHADRLRASAGELGYSFDENSWRHLILEAVDPIGSGKVRSLLHPDGTVDVESHVLRPHTSVWRAVLSKFRIDATDPYRRHKTTRRRLYDEEWRRAVAAGFDEVLFLNLAGEWAEGSRTNIILRIGETWCTPPVESGALPGVYRRHLIETRDVRECVVRPADFETADEVYLCNAVRGLVRAHVALAPDPVSGDVT